LPICLRSRPFLILLTGRWTIRSTGIPGNSPVALPHQPLVQPNQPVFFLESCIDQVKFMAELMRPFALRKRILDWVKQEERIGGLMPNSTRVLAHILTHRELERKDVTEVVGFDDRKSRRVTAMPHKRGIIAAPTHRAALRIAFPAALAPGLMPGHYPRLPKSP
jgi:hypothetical protein